jgi:NAD(P)-dependent dehydrogenase (short-subunit alcohol dehydrogenase family)
MMLDETVVVVTGGAGLLGRVFVRDIVEHGGIAVVADIDMSAAANFVSELPEQYAARAHAMKLDITDTASVAALISAAFKRFGRIDAVVNNAYPRNPHYGRKLENVTYDDFCQNLSLHLGGYFLVSQQFGLFFRSQHKGNIINMASIYGVMAPRFEIYSGTQMTMPVEYAAIKSAVIHLTRYFAQYFKNDHVRVNSLSPGGILDQQPELFLRNYRAFCSSKGMLEGKDISSVLLFLLSDASKYLTGQNLVVDDGFSI